MSASYIRNMALETVSLYGLTIKVPVDDQVVTGKPSTAVLFNKTGNTSISNYIKMMWDGSVLSALPARSFSRGMLALNLMTEGWHEFKLYYGGSSAATCTNLLTTRRVYYRVDTPVIENFKVSSTNLNIGQTLHLSCDAIDRFGDGSAIDQLMFLNRGWAESSQITNKTTKVTGGTLHFEADWRMTKGSVGYEYTNLTKPVKDQFAFYAQAGYSLVMNGSKTSSIIAVTVNDLTAPTLGTLKTEVVVNGSEMWITLSGNDDSGRISERTIIIYKNGETSEFRRSTNTTMVTSGTSRTTIFSLPDGGYNIGYRIADPTGHVITGRDHTVYTIKTMDAIYSIRLKE